MTLEFKALCITPIPNCFTEGKTYTFSDKGGLQNKVSAKDDQGYENYFEISGQFSVYKWFITGGGL